MTNLLAELKRRNVFRVTAAYLVISWLLLQIGDVLFDALRLDESYSSLLVAILALGFIPVIGFSWVYEITPEGIKKDADVPLDNSIVQHTAKKLDIITILCLLTLIGLYWLKPSAPLSDTTQINSKSQQLTEQKDSRQSIAVLPFEDMSSDGDQAYFGDGIAEELLNSLAKAKGLRVAARTSSFKFKGTDADIPQIGKALNVKTVLEGSIRKAGDQVRITAQLINVEDGYHIWSEAYDRKLDNIFKVQDEITLAIVNALKVHLDIDDSVHGAQNPEAYELYLRGRQFARIINKENQLKAVDYYQQAIDIDPKFSKAYAGIAAAWIWLEDYGGYAAEIAFPKIERAARMALKLNPKEAEAIMSLGLFYSRVKDDIEIGQLLFEYAIELNPSLVAAHHHYADILETLGQTEEGIRFRLKGIALDPLSTFYRSRLVNSYRTNQQFELAKAQLEIIFEINPEDDYGFEELANLQAMTFQEYAQAYQTYKRVHQLRPGDPYSAHHLSMIAHILDLEKQQAYWLDQAQARGENNRWQLLAEQDIYLVDADVMALRDLAPRFLKRDPNVTATILAFAYYLEGEYQAAQQQLELVTRDPRFYNDGQLNHNYVLAEVIQALISPFVAATQYDSLARFNKYYQNLGDKGALIGESDDNIHSIAACIELANNGTDQALAMSYLEKAYQSGFRKLKQLNNWPCYQKLVENNEFQTLVSKIKQYNANQRELLLEALGEQE